MILYCSCAHGSLVPETTRAAVSAGLSSRSDATGVADLCGLAAQHDSRLGTWARNDSLTIIACRPRAIRWLFDWAGAPLRPDAAILDLRSLDAGQVLAALPRARARSKPKPLGTGQQGSWVPWFPVIDRGRCVNCKQCASFCAFGVYATEAGSVQVRNPANCKNNCPACARMCPQVAIIFPKCAEEPIDGSAVTDEYQQQRLTAAQKHASAGGELRGLLAGRGRHRQGAKGVASP